MVDFPIEDRVADLQAPLLVIRGSADPIARMDWCRRLRGRAGSAASLVIVPGHRHLVQHTAPAAVASAVRAFVAEGAL
jgi:pimeloyl-ACP methyl ester carboxylesterase